MDEIDNFFATALDFSPWTGEIEKVLGLAGYSPYIARRARKTKQSTLFNRLVTGYESVAITIDEKQIAWSQPKQSVYRFDKENLEQHEFNLGLAHGVPGIIAELIPALQDDEVKERAQKLVVSVVIGCSNNRVMQRIKRLVLDLALEMTLTPDWAGVTEISQSH